MCEYANLVAISGVSLQLPGRAHGGRLSLEVSPKARCQNGAPWLERERKSSVSPKCQSDVKLLENQCAGGTASDTAQGRVGGAKAKTTKADLLFLIALLPCLSPLNTPQITKIHILITLSCL